MIKRIRFYAAFATTYVRRGKKRALFGLVSLLLLVGFFSFFLPFITPKVTNIYFDTNKPTFVEGVVGKPSYPNPIFDSTETQKDISSLVFRALLKTDSNGALVPDLAEKFEKKSDLEYVAVLKKDIKWQDGKSFRADDVIHTIELARDEESEVADNFKDVKVEKVDDFTVAFKLKEPFSPFPYAATTPILPRHISLSSYRPVGTGKFAVKQVSHDKIVLSGPEVNVVFKFYNTIEEAKIALKLGEIHSVGGLSPQETEDLSRFGSAKLMTETFHDRQGVVYFNTRSGPLKDKAVRQGLSFALDKEKLRKAAGGPFSVLSSGPFSLKSAVPQPKERYLFSIENSLKSFNKAGFNLENDTLVRGGKKLTLTVVSTDDPELNSIVNFLKESWLNLGVETKTKHVDSETLLNQVVPNHSFEILVNFQKISPDPDQYVLWHTTQVQSTNISGISQPKLDKLLEDARKTADAAQRVEKYKVFSNLLLDEAPAVFLYYPQYSWFVSEKVTGVSLKNFSSPQNRFDSLDNWKIKTSLLAKL